MIIYEPLDLIDRNLTYGYVPFGQKTISLMEIWPFSQLTLANWHMNLGSSTLAKFLPKKSFGIAGDRN
jgi:hypothetical protein